MARVLISPEDQYYAKEALELNWSGLARYLQVHKNTFENWYKGKRLLPTAKIV